MQITFAMLWDRLNAVYPALETALYGGQPVRGIKLTPAQGEREPDVLFGGRLGEYKYYDMDKVIASALGFAARELN